MSIVEIDRSHAQNKNYHAHYTRLRILGQYFQQLIDRNIIPDPGELKSEYSYAGSAIKHVVASNPLDKIKFSIALPKVDKYKSFTTPVKINHNK